MISAQLGDTAGVADIDCSDSSSRTLLADRKREASGQETDTTVC